MSSKNYIIQCSIPPPSVVYIKENTMDNEFTIEFKKIPLNYVNEYFKNGNQETILIEKNKSNAKIYIRLNLGEGVDDLCTIQQASNMTFTTLKGEGWTMIWSNPSECFIVTPPNNFDFPDSYVVSFRSNKFYTSAKQGSTTLEAYFVEFPDIRTKITAVNLYKWYPIDIEYFKVSSNKVEINKKITISWKILNATKCYITGIGEVDTSGSKEIIIDKPKCFELSAENGIGMTKRSEIKVGCKKPTIKLWSDNDYCHKGDLVTLYWESSSATSIQIEPLTGEFPSSGEISIKVESNTYTAIANGYNDFHSYVAIERLNFKETPWKKVGNIKGVDLKKDLLNSDHKIWEYNGFSYLFCNKILYKSCDLIIWEKVSELEIEIDMTLNSYGTTVIKNTFIVVGITKRDSNFIQVASYDFDEKKWTIGDSIAGIKNIGGKIANVGGKAYYGKKGAEMVIFFSPEKLMDDKWNLKLYYKNEKMDDFDITSIRDCLYLAVHQSNDKKIALKSIELKDNKWRDLNSTNQEINGWFSLIPTKGVIYLLSKDSMIDISDFKSVSPFHPSLEDNYLPWTGSNNNIPFLISKDGVLWCYKE